MLTFLSPLFLLGAAAAAVPIVLHLLKREPEARVRFAAVRLLKSAPVEHTARHRLRELLLLALRVSALVLLALAFARPFFATAGGAALNSVRIVALDTSYSLSAPGRYDRARQLAAEAVAKAGAGDLVGVVTFADTAQVVSPPSADHVLARSAIGQAAPSFGATRYRTALSAAAQALAGRRGTIVVVTDLQENGWDAGDRAAVPARTAVEIADVGPPPPNLAVISVRPLADRIVATLRNTGPSAREARARLTVDGRPAGAALAALGANQSGDVTFGRPPAGTVAAVAVEDPDGLQADNIRYAALAGASRPGVLVVSGDGASGREAFYVQEALAAGEAGGRAYQVTVTSGAQLSRTEDRLAAQAAVVLLSTRGLERRGREALAAYVRGGGGLFVAAGPEIDGEVAADVLGSDSPIRIDTGSARSQPRALAPADARHPIFAPFAGASATLTLVRFQNAARIEGDGCATLARFTTGDKALIECAAGDGRALIFASDLDNRWNDFPLHASFVPFVHEAVRFLSAAQTYASSYLVGDAPAAVPRAPGVHELAAARPGGAPRQVAVNVDPREGDPARMTVDDFQTAVEHLKDAGAAARVEARQQEDDQHLWQYALALMLLALAAEGAIAGRTA